MKRLDNDLDASCVVIQDTAEVRSLNLQPFGEKKTMPVSLETGIIIQFETCLAPQRGQIWALGRTYFVMSYKESQKVK